MSFFLVFVQVYRMYQMKRTPLSIIDDAFHYSLSSESILPDSTSRETPRMNSDTQMYRTPTQALFHGWNPTKISVPPRAAQSLWCIPSSAALPCSVIPLHTVPYFIVLPILRQISPRGGPTIPARASCWPLAPSAQLTLKEIGLSSIASCRPRSFVSSCPAIANGVKE